ncbi:MAG: PhoH-like protein [Chlamydiae bacterium]|nr:PhoH-like protein [Chlamydiota bacterium]
MKKTFVLDTNVLLHDPESFLKFARHNVVIPLTVLEELDKMKRFQNELGRNARTVARQLALLKNYGKGDLHKGVEIENGSSIRIQMEWERYFVDTFDLSISDNKILMVAYYLNKKGEKVVFVSKDFAARVKAEAMGLEAADYENLKVSYDTIHKGVRRLEVTKPEIDQFYKDGSIELAQNEFLANEYCVLMSPEKSSAVVRYNPESSKLESLLNLGNVWGIQPRNVEQKCAMDAILRDDIRLVTLMGPAGTGKTLLSLACGLRKVFDEGDYNRILVSRPIVPLGRDIGYLPGTKEEKLSSWMQPIMDNLEYVCDTTGGGTGDTLRWVLDSNKIEMEAVTYIRGRSLPKIFMIVDEAQNLTPHEVKTIISRAGEGTKVILSGDPEQIDNPYLDKNSNGLTYTVGRFQNQPLFCNIFLDKTERSQLAAIAADIM